VDCPGIIVWNVVFDHVIVVAGREAGGGGGRGRPGGPYARVEEWMRPAARAASGSPALRLQRCWRWAWGRSCSRPACESLLRCEQVGQKLQRLRIRERPSHVIVSLRMSAFFVPLARLMSWGTAAGVA
jgi:hypothetical protein